MTWFEFAPDDAAAFDELPGLLRATTEWQFVERKVDESADNSLKTTEASVELSRLSVELTTLVQRFKVS